LIFSFFSFKICFWLKRAPLKSDPADATLDYEVAAIYGPGERLATDKLTRCLPTVCGFIGMKCACFGLRAIFTFSASATLKHRLIYGVHVPSFMMQ
jgi:hypothetical protein